MRIEDTPENRKRMLDVASALEGSARTLEGALVEVFGEEVEDVDNVDITLLHLLDDEVMQCETCGWWCDRGEFPDDDMICEDCLDGY